MQLTFSKYSGSGNDFVMLDNRDLSIALSPVQIQKLCNRQNGIGADGVIFLESSKRADYGMRIFNADGSEAEMCGNGIRCLMKFAQEVGINSSTLTIETMHRILEVSHSGNEVCCSMGDPANIQWDIPLTIGNSSYILHSLDTGVPHAVIFTQNLEDAPVFAHGKAIRHHTQFTPKGTNVNFAQITGPQQVSVRTYERGVENETLACGTGVTATAIAAAVQHQLVPPLQILTFSGKILTVDFHFDGKNIKNVTQKGPAEKIFSGTITL